MCNIRRGQANKHPLVENDKLLMLMRLLVGGFDSGNCEKIVNLYGNKSNEIKPDHYVFDYRSGWKFSKSLPCKPTDACC